MESLSTAKLELRSGGSIPQIGLGAWQVMGPRAREPILSALGIGYRHVDGVRLFAGEAVLGAAMRESGIPREEIFVTLKLWNDSKGYDAALRGFETALKRGGLEYVDLYLIHRLYGDELRGTWRAIEEIRKSGRARALGTSNYGVYNLEPHAGAGESPLGTPAWARGAPQVDRFGTSKGECVPVRLYARRAGDGRDRCARRRARHQARIGSA